MKIKIPIAAVIILGFIYFSNKAEIDKMFLNDQPAMCRRCRIRRCASLAGGGLSAARTVAFARGEASIAARCMRHASRQRVRELLAER